MLVGFGYDVHRLVPGRDLYLGGIKVPHEKGLLGHSDADVLVHAVMDALLGAAGERDIGYHFPDTDPAYEGISSLELLGKVSALLKKRGLRPRNVDSTVLAERPKLASYISAMRRTMADVLGLDPARVNVKATTNEGLGFVGTGEGIAAYAVATLEEVAEAPRPE